MRSVKIDIAPTPREWIGRGVEGGFEDPEGDSAALLVRLWARYELGAKPTSLGAIYGAHLHLERVHSRFSCRPGDNGARRYHDIQACRSLKKLLEDGWITVAPVTAQLLANINGGD